MMRNAVRGLAPSILAAVALSGCSSASDGSGSVDTKPAATVSSPAAADKAVDKAVVKGGTVGAPGSACVLPVAFDLAAHWKPEAVAVDLSSEFAALGQQGPVTLVCEIDAKPAGKIGFLRVWTGDASDSTPRQVLEAFLADGPDAEKITYRETKTGSLPVAEAAYTVTSELMDESKTESAFAVSTPDGPVVVHLGGMDSVEHQLMLPAYELARKTLKLG